MKKTRKALALLMTLCLAMGMLATSAFAGEKNVTLRFSWWGSDARHEATLAVIDMYMEQNPGVVIEAEYGGYDGYLQKIATQLAGGTEPDIMQIDQPWLADFTTQNPEVFVDLNGTGGAVDMSGFSPDMLADFATYNDKLVGLPTGIAGQMFLANKIVLDGAGAQFPAEGYTWDDLLEQGRKVNEWNPEAYLLNMNLGSIQLLLHTYLYQLTGKSLVNDGDYTPAFTTDELAQAFEMIQTLYDAKVIVPLEESTLFASDAATNPKWNGNLMGGWFAWSSMAEQQSWGDENVLSLPFPIMENAKDTGVIVRPSQILSVSPNSKDVDEALAFVNFFFNDPEAIAALRDTRSIPATSNGREVLVERDLMYEPANEGTNWAVDHAGLPESVLTGNSEVRDAIQSCLEKLLYAQYDAKAAAEEAFAQVSDILANLQASRS